MSYLSRVQITCLGSGDAFNAAARHHSSYLLTDSGSRYLIDCGPSALYTLKAQSLSAAHLEAVLITHLHGDHIAGLPFILLDRLFQESEPPLSIYGPKGLEERLNLLMQANYPGIVERFGSEHYQVFEVDSRTLIDIGNLKCRWIPVSHTPKSNPHGIRIESDEFCVGFSGDSEWTDNLIEIADNTQLFFLECNFLEMQVPGHLSWNTLSKEINRLKSDRVILVHLGNKMREQKLDGVELAEDGRQYLLPELKISSAVKRWQDCSVEEVTDCLALRSEIFVVEQDCVYQDIDGKDKLAWHYFLYEGRDLASYARIFKAGDYFQEASIGRIVTREKFRSRGLGARMIEDCVSFCEKQFPQSDIRISAQSHLKKYYNRFGFIEEGEAYLEDGIPHLSMRKKAKNE